LERNKYEQLEAMLEDIWHKMSLDLNGIDESSPYHVLYTCRVKDVERALIYTKALNKGEIK
jgi:hypothetical protein